MPLAPLPPFTEPRTSIWRPTLAALLTILLVCTGTVNGGTETGSAPDYHAHLPDLAEVLPSDQSRWSIVPASEQDADVAEPPWSQVSPRAESPPTLAVIRLSEATAPLLLANRRHSRQAPRGPPPTAALIRPAVAGH